jgi:hypothetical protein
MAQANRLQPGKQPPLLFIEQAIEQKGGSLHFLGRGQEVGRGMEGRRNGLSTVPDQPLLATWDGLHGGSDRSFEEKISTADAAPGSCENP